MYTLFETEITNKKLKTSHSDGACIWHLRLHIDQERITRFVKDDTLSTLREINLPQFESCLDGKMTMLEKSS